MSIVADNYKRVCERIAAAAARAGRDPADITLVAVTKTVDIPYMNEVAELGAADFGENRVQEYTRKRELVDNRISWHLIGQIQTNKVKYIQEDVKLIHSLDRPALAAELQRQAVRQGRTYDALIEVNLSGEVSKMGCPKEKLTELTDTLIGCDRIRVKGFMTMAPIGTDDETSRPYFGELNELMQRCRSIRADNFDLTQLSMGMTHDYCGAIMEGATIVRIGSAIFADRL